MMDDLISREKTIDAIEGITWYHQNRNNEMVMGANSDEDQPWYKADDVYKAIEEVPSELNVMTKSKLNSLYGFSASDVVAVIRCKDCEYWQTDWQPHGGMGHYCPMIDLVTNSLFYCAEGERKE